MLSQLTIKHQHFKMLTDDFTINILLSQVMEREWWKNNYMLLPSHIYLGPSKMESWRSPLGVFVDFWRSSSALEEGITKVNQNADTRHVSKGSEEVYEARIRLTAPPEKNVWKTKLSSTEKQFCRQEVDEISDRRDIRWWTEERNTLLVPGGQMRHD